MGDGWVVFDDAVGPFDHEGHAIGVPVHFQVFAVGVAVVESAQRHEVADFVGSAVLAVFDVVDVRPLDWSATAGESAAQVAGLNRSTILFGTVEVGVPMSNGSPLGLMRTVVMMQSHSNRSRVTVEM